MFQRRYFTILLIVALALTAVVSVLVSPASAQGKSLKIGLMNDTSGALKQYGKELNQGFTLGLKYATGGKMEVAGRKLEVLERDNAGKPDVGASQAREVIEKDGAEVLAGPPSSGVAAQLQQVAKDLDVILMAGPAASATITTTGFNVNTFRACRNAATDFIALSTVLKDSGIKSVIVLAADYDFGRSGAAAAEASYKAIGMEVKPTIYAPLTTTDFTLYLQQVLSSKAGAIQPIWAGDTSVALYKQLEELGVRKQMTVIDAFNSNPIVKAASVPGQVGNVGFIVYHYTLPKTKINDWLVENHKKDYKGEVPDLFTECGFATAQALVAGLEKTKGDASSKALIPALEGLLWDGPRGAYYMRPADHQVLLPLYVVKLVSVTDPDFKFYELVKEIPADQATPACVLPDAVKDRCDKLPWKMPAVATPAPTAAK